MIVLDENFPESQRQLLRRWGFRIHQVGYEVGRKGLKDNEIIPLLFQLRFPTFFSLDSDFYKPKYCHSRCCLVYVNVSQSEAAYFIRRFLKHSEYETKNKRRGSVLRISHIGISVWRLHSEKEEFINWVNK
jgi:hypothetical protein